MILQQRRYLYFLLYILFPIVTFAPAASAETLLLGGFNASSQSQYGYIGAIVPIYSTLAGQGFRVRLWGSYQDYEFDGKLAGGPTGTPTSFDADGFGASLSLGYRWKFESGDVTAYAGIAYKDIDLSPDDPSSDTEDDDVGARFQLEINPQLSTNVDVSLIGSYTIVFDDYWARLRPGYKFANGLKFGPEVIALGGNDSSDTQQYGAFLDGIKFGSVKFGFHGGYEDSDDDSGAYGGISLSTVF